ncbi:hypothetical protein SAMN06269250_2039 [Spirosoma fluviale]|uniref:Uncharacterized protein n=1 Tax=Spirosoma fluviale TaxID=1597977 RepID=A0A286FGE3_9BACT|nr:hypothetical protein SAMN06269250_2039 [Spirosoma fluviale]
MPVIRYSELLNRSTEERCMMYDIGYMKNYYCHTSYIKLSGLQL